MRKHDVASSPRNKEIRLGTIVTRRNGSGSIPNSRCHSKIARSARESISRRIISAKHDDATDCWAVEIENGEILKARYLITAVGCLSAANLIFAMKRASKLQQKVAKTSRLIRLSYHLNPPPTYTLLSTASGPPRGAWSPPDVSYAAMGCCLARGIGVERLRDPPIEWSQQVEALGLSPE
jgi:hypothetical protein